MPDPAHDRHDLELLAALADRTVDPATRARAEALTASCATCRALADDLRSLTASLASLPASRPAPRDMRLSPETAARARRGAGLRRLLRPFGGSSWAPLRPVGASLAGLGLAGILLTGGLVGGPLGGAPAANPTAGGAGFNGAATAVGQADTGAPAPSQQAVDANGATSPAPPEASLPHVGLGLASAAPVPVPSAGTSVGYGAEAGSATTPPTGATTKGSSEAPAAPGLAFGPSAAPGAPAPTIPPLTLLSIAVLAVGLAMLGLRLAARRMA